MDYQNKQCILIREQGKLKESLKLLQEVLEIREKVNGPTHQTVRIHVHVS